MANHSLALDSVFDALGNPTRRAVVRRLGDGPATVTELAEPFTMALPSFMKHLGVLERSGLVRSRKNGRVRTCELRVVALRRAEEWMAQQRKIWEAHTDRLANHVETLHEKEQQHVQR